ISKNRIHDPYKGDLADVSAAYGIYLTGADATPGNENIISNNLIYNFYGGGTQYGIYNASSDSARYFHNTISLEDGSYAGTSATRGFYQVTTAKGLEFRNNIVRIARGGAGIKYTLYFGATTTASTIFSDNNDLFITSSLGTNGIGYLAVPTPAMGYATLAEWTGATGFDASSLNLDPLFTDTLNGNFTPTNAALDNKGINVGITTDINNVTRGVLPDMGAIEFPATPVPVTLLNVFASKLKNDIFLNWSTAQEVNSNKFEIERSLDGNAFIIAGFVNASGNSNSFNSYNFKDANAVQLATGDYIYYRLKLIDRDAKFVYSKVVRVNIKEESTATVSVYPNPFTTVAYLKINLQRPELVSITISDASGKQVLNQATKAYAGMSLVNIHDSEKLAAGLYFASVEINGNKQVLKIVKK
ncbi:MAG: T9SS type A sorting domain-containing protein, partial [Chitinophagaceae bacterium]